MSKATMLLPLLFDSFRRFENMEGAFTYRLDRKEYLPPVGKRTHKTKKRKKKPKINHKRKNKKR